MTDYSRGRGDLQAEPTGYGDGIIATMTTINNIADLVRILKEQPEWADTIRGILLSEELLELPARFAEFVQLTQESHRIINERLTQIDTRVDRLETGQTETNRRLGSSPSRDQQNPKPRTTVYAIEHQDEQPGRQVFKLGGQRL